MVRTGILRSLLSPVSRGVRAPLVELLGYASDARLSLTRCELAVGEQFLSWIRVLRFDYSRVPSVPSTFDAVLLVCLRCLRIYGLVSVACSCDPTFIAYPHGLPIVRYLGWFFRHVWYLVLCFPRSLCADYADGSSAGSCRCLAQCCRGGGFFPKYAVFLASLGISVLA